MKLYMQGDFWNMKTKYLKCMAAAAALILLFALSGVSVYADSVGDSTSGSGGDNDSDWNDDWNSASGKCGDNIDWFLDNSDGLLTINGSGSMWSRTTHGDKLWNTGAVKSVSFSGSITSIGSEAFAGCNNLRLITLPRSVKTIGDKAFMGCSSLRKAELVNTVNRIGENCFADCGVLTDLYFTGSRQDWLFLVNGVQTGLTSDVFLHYNSTIDVTSQPVNVKAALGTTVKFSVKAEGNGTLQYQWYYRKKGTSAWNIWKGHTTATTSAVANDTWNGMQLYCRIQDSINYVSSDPCVVTLSYPIVIQTQPTDVTTSAGSTAKFSVKAQGSGLQYQWYYKKAGAGAWSLWRGHTTATTSAVANDTWDGMQVYCLVTDGSGASLNSQPATIKLNGMPKITLQPSDVTTKAGEVTKFIVKAQGSNLKYQWYYKKAGVTAWSLWRGHITATTSATANATWNGMQVYCVITDGFGRKVSSKSSTVTIKK